MTDVKRACVKRGVITGVLVALPSESPVARGTMWQSNIHFDAITFTHGVAPKRTSELSCHVAHTIAVRFPASALTIHAVLTWQGTAEAEHRYAHRTSWRNPPASGRT